MTKQERKTKTKASTHKRIMDILIDDGLGFEEACQAAFAIIAKTRNTMLTISVETYHKINEEISDLCMIQSTTVNGAHRVLRRYQKHYDFDMSI